MRQHWAIMAEGGLERIPAENMDSPADGVSKRHAKKTSGGRLPGVESVRPADAVFVLAKRQVRNCSNREPWAGKERSRAVSNTWRGAGGQVGTSRWSAKGFCPAG
eukprot:GHVT01072919.1.p1 GENE.GHVT01072919.1~~GHVT01072919.1.p1  ORF type:complete len:105 (+),score=8.26 GHVT01072919.1:803-1117(+)